VKCCCRSNRSCVFSPVIDNNSMDQHYCINKTQVLVLLEIIPISFHSGGSSLSDFLFVSRFDDFAFFPPRTDSSDSYVDTLAATKCELFFIIIFFTASVASHCILCPDQLYRATLTIRKIAENICFLAV
jgi:hypothetical protein